MTEFSEVLAKAQHLFCGEWISQVNLHVKRNTYACMSINRKKTIRYFMVIDLSKNFKIDRMVLHSELSNACVKHALNVIIGTKIFLTPLTSAHSATT
jgi:hypothetical protein